VAVALGALALAALPAEAQRDVEPLFDTFNLKLEGSWVALSTEVRLDSKESGRGTTLTFEDDLNLDSSKTVPSLAFEWQISHRNRLGVRWQDIDRDSSSQALTEFRWGDEVVPVDAAVTLSFDVTQYAIDWTYYPWVRERWAAGFGLGLRVLEIGATLEWQELNSGSGGAESSSVTGPLPYVNFEYRRLLGEHWRMTAGLGWLDVTVEDISGGQWLARASLEYLLGERWAFGGSVNLSTIDADAESADFIGSIAFDVNDVSLFARVRFGTR
jgi:hypothetical protein